MGAYKPEDFRAGDSARNANVPQAFFDFFNNDYNVLSSLREIDANNGSTHDFPLPRCTIIGNCSEAGIEQGEGSNGSVFVREIFNDYFTADAVDGTSSIVQEGTGQNAHRTWSDDDGRQITRIGDQIYVDVNENAPDGEMVGEYSINAETGVVERQFGRWRVRQQTMDKADAETGSSTGTASQVPTMDITVFDIGEERETSLDFIDPNTNYVYHATDEGIEIVIPGSNNRFLWAGRQLFALIEPAAGDTDLFTGNDGRTFSKSIRTVDNRVSMLAINKEDGSVCIDGMTVTVENGTVTAESTRADRLSIELTADGGQMVTSADGYSTYIGPNGVMVVFGPNEEIVAYFDPHTGIVGNETVQFGADFSCIDGQVLDLMFVEMAVIVEAHLLEERAQANAEATAAIQQTDTIVGSVVDRISQGTVRPDCFAALTGCIGDLNGALAACVASGATESIGAIVAAIGEVQHHLSLAHCKFNSERAGRLAGVTDVYLLSKLQQCTSSTTDCNALVRTVVPTPVPVPAPVPEPTPAIATPRASVQTPLPVSTPVPLRPPAVPLHA